MSTTATAPLIVDRRRWKTHQGKTGILLRARYSGRWVQVDLAELDDASRTRWVAANPEARHVAALLAALPDS